MKLLSGGLIILLCFLSSKASACSCSQLSIDEYLKRAALVVTATVVKPVSEDKVQLHFDDIWKGNAPSDVTVELLTGFSSSCGAEGFIQPPKGSKFVFYLGKLKTDGTGSIHFTPCGRNIPYEKADLDIPKLEAYRNEIKKLDEEISQSKNSQEAHYKKVQFLQAHEDLTTAEDALEALTKKYPKFAEGWREYASLVFKQAEKIHAYGDDKEKLNQEKQELYSRTLDYTDSALALEADNKQSQDTRTITLMKLGRAQEADLNNADLSKQKIHFQTFQDKALKGTILDSAGLFGIEFVNAQLNEISALNTKLMRTKFTNSSIDASKFDNADISDGAGMDGDKAITFKNGGFENTTITNSSFRKVRFNAPVINTKISKSDFEGAGFEGSFKEDSQILIGNVNATDSNFRKIRTSSQFGRYSEIRDSVFHNCDFSEANISSRITNVDFSTSNLGAADLSGSSYDCKTKWPAGFDPGLHGATSDEPSCDGKAITKPDFTGKNFNGSIGGPINLANVSFKNANLEGKSFFKTNLKNTDFSDAKVQNADFRNADLEGAIFKNVYLYGVNFDGTNLKNVDFTGADFSNARFGNSVNFNEAKTTLARIGPDALKNLPKTFNAENSQFVYWLNRDDACLELPIKPLNMAGKDLSRLNLSYSCLNNGDFSNAIFDKGSLYDTDLRGANLKGASFKGVIYGCGTRLPEDSLHILEQMILIESGCRSTHSATKTNLPSADLTKTNLRNAYLRNANLQNANLSEATLDSADMFGANLTGADVKGATYTHSTRWPDNFDYKAAGAIEAKPKDGSYMRGGNSYRIGDN